MSSLETKALPAQPLGTDLVSPSQPVMKQDVLAMTAGTREAGWIPGVSVLSIQRDTQGLEVMHRKVTIFTGKKQINLECQLL